MKKRIEWNWNIINPAFYKLSENNNRYLICYGGRGSSKSDFAAKKLIYHCITDNHFRCIMIRRVGAKVKDSSYQNIKDLISEMGISHLFNCVSTPTPRITYIKTGNYFVGAGLDDTSKIKSIKDPTHAWWEEDIPDESDFITVTTSLRTLKADNIQEIFSINPEVEGDYREHWFFQYFFKGHYDNGEFSFSDKIEMQVDGKFISVDYTVHHSTHDDNPHLPDQFRAFLLSLQKTNPYYYTVYTRGHWGTKITEGRFYKHFDQTVHTDKLNVYDKEKPLHISFDFNVHPGVSISIWQIDGKRLNCIDEILAKDPDNSTEGACNLFIDRYGGHEGGLFVYGDPTGRNEDTKTERGHNNYSIIRKKFKPMHPQVRLFTVAPSVAMRGNFINAVFDHNEGGLNVSINEKCTQLINDLLFGKIQSDGTKLKEKAKNKETGITAEKYHHFSDGFDYLIIKAFFNEYAEFKSTVGKFDYKIEDPRIIEAKRFRRK